MFIKRLGNRVSLLSLFIWENTYAGKQGLVQSYTVICLLLPACRLQTMQTHGVFIEKSSMSEPLY